MRRPVAIIAGYPFQVVYRVWVEKADREGWLAKA
jgi:hypothetical protein